LANTAIVAEAWNYHKRADDDHVEQHVCRSGVG
jgi:hypothetical protein